MQRFTSLSSLHKELSNGKTLARKEVFGAILQNLKRQEFYPLSSALKNILVLSKVAHIIYVRDTRSGDKTAAIHGI